MSPTRSRRSWLAGNSSTARGPHGPRLPLATRTRPGPRWDSLGSPVAWLLLGVAAASLAVGLARRRVNWTNLGLVVTALASVEMGVQTGVFPSRYYLASLVLLAVVCVRVLGRICGLDGWVGWLVLAELGLIAVISLALPTLPSGPGRPMTRQASNSRTPLASFAPADAGSRSRGRPRTNRGGQSADGRDPGSPQLPSRLRRRGVGPAARQRPARHVRQAAARAVEAPGGAKRCNSVAAQYQRIGSACSD